MTQVQPSGHDDKTIGTPETSNVVTKSKKFDVILFVLFVIGLSRLGILQTEGLTGAKELSINADAQKKLDAMFGDIKYVHLKPNANEAEITENNNLNEEAASQQQNIQNVVSTYRMLAQTKLTSVSTIMNFLSQHSNALSAIIKSLNTAVSSILEMNQPLM